MLTSKSSAEADGSCIGVAQEDSGEDSLLRDDVDEGERMAKRSSSRPNRVLCSLVREMEWWGGTRRRREGKPQVRGNRENQPDWELVCP